MKKYRIKCISDGFGSKYAVQYKFWCIWLNCTVVIAGYSGTGLLDKPYINYDNAIFYSQKEALYYLEWIKSEHIIVYKGYVIVKTYAKDLFRKDTYYVTTSHLGKIDIFRDLKDLKDLIDKRTKKKKVTYINI